MKVSTEVQNLLSFLHLQCVDIPLAITKWLMQRQASCVGVTESWKERGIFSHPFFFSKVMETFSRKLPGTSHFFPSVRMGAHALPSQQLAGRLGQLCCRSGEGVCPEHIYTVRLSLRWRWEGYSYATEYLYHLKSVCWVMLEINERKTYKYPCPHGAYVLMRKTDCKQMACCWW